MIFVPRKVKQCSRSPHDEQGTESLPLESLRSLHAWILLGEPGAGKTEAFKSEAQTVNGLRVTIADFIYGEIDEAWKGKCLFLDGLDEVRARASNESILIQVRSKLRQLGLPDFRIACRAADWFGQSDCEDIIGASPDGLLPIYALEPLTACGIQQILEDHFKGSLAEDFTSLAENFIAQAEAQGVSGLLSNPQTLCLTVKALGAKHWPSSRNEIYHLACKALVQEENPKHRNLTRLQPALKDAVLEAAGQLFATLLLADKSGIALDPSAQNDRFPAWTDLEPNTPETAALALRTALFVPTGPRDQLLEPTHRSVAEYLAADWLGKQIDSSKFALNRILNLMLGFDGKAVAGLRGLYGWLALKSRHARHRLIRNDPLAIALYSDPQLMDVEAKRLLLQEVRAQMAADPSILWNLRDAENISALFDTELRHEYLAALLDQRRDDTSQTYVIFILKVIKPFAAQSQLTKELHDLATDDTRWTRIRRDALEAWLGSGVTNNDAIQFLNQLNQGKISDPDEELAGILLRHLFPGTLSSTQVLSYLHQPKCTTLGTYHYFWAYEFPDTVPEGDLPDVLDQLATRKDLQPLNDAEFHTSRMLAALVNRGIQVHGDQIPNAQLFRWLHVGTDEYGERRHEPEFDSRITQWLSNRPDRYKGLLGICFERNQTAVSPLQGLFNDSQILRGIPPPADIGLWHFERIDHSRNTVLAKEHLEQAMRSLWSEQPGSGLSFDMVLAWAGNDPVKTSWLEPLCAWEIPEWRKVRSHANQQRQQTQSDVKRNRSITLASKLAAIRSGDASPALMDQLAAVWLNRYTDIRGDTPLDRFKNYCDNPVDVYESAKAGMLALIKRRDLPSPGQIIELHLQQQAHMIRSACLLGMELAWASDPAEVESMCSETLETMVCFQLTDSTGASPAWFMHLIMNRPTLVSNMLTAYAGACFRAHKPYVEGIWPLARDAAYAQVARLCVPALIASFPTRNRAHQLEQLNSLLRSALKYAMPELPTIVADKLKRRSLDPSQRVYFLLTGMLVDPGTYEDSLWLFVGNTWQRIQHIASFLGSRLSDLPMDFNLSAKTLGRLIEIQTPFAEVDWPMGGGIISAPMNLGEHVRGLIGKLSAMGSTESLEEINRLLALPVLGKIRHHLIGSKHEAIQRLRENGFSHFTLSDVASILGNKPPVGPADLQAIVLNRLDDIATEIQTSNSDLFRQFWTEGTDNRHKSENSCRDALLSMLRRHLVPMSIDSQPEFDYVNDKRADIRVSYGNAIAIPIEIKGEWHPDLWTAAQNQLSVQYTGAKGTDGFGIYLVLWVGGTEQKAARDRGKKPLTAVELQSRLQKSLPESTQRQIAVRVIDVSWPNRTA